jgi:hypothetical protein
LGNYSEFEGIRGGVLYGFIAKRAIQKIWLIFLRWCDIMYLMKIGGWGMSNASILKAMANAEASIHMEGMTVSDTCKELCRRILTNEISFEEYLRQITTTEGTL